MLRKYKKILPIAGAMALLAACATGSKMVDPSKPGLLEEYPESKVFPIGALRTLNVSRRPFDGYPELALRNFPNEAPKVGCVMLEVLVGTDGRVKRTKVAESYPKRVFDFDAKTDVRSSRYSAQDQEVITYHFYQFNLDDSRDTGLIKTYRDVAATEVLLEMDFKRRYENLVKDTTGWSTSAMGITRMPGNCKSLYNKYAVFKGDKATQAPKTEG